MLAILGIIVGGMVRGECFLSCELYNDFGGVFTDCRLLKSPLILERRIKMGFLYNMFKNKSSGVNNPLQTSQTTSRVGDGTALGDAILQGRYLPEAGSESIGYFDPGIAPFRVLSDGRIGLLYDPKWDQMLSEIQAEQAKLRASGGIVYDQPIEESLLGRFAALAIAIKLGLPTIKEVVNVFESILENEAIATFLAGTTTNHFFFKYTDGAVWFSQEVASEIILNSLANILLKDPEFASIHSVAEFESKAVFMLERRKHEMRNPW